MRPFRSTDRHRAEALSRLGPFSDMSVSDVRKVAKAATTVSLEPGDVMAEEGDRPSGAYVVLSGELAVSQSGEPIRDLGPGDLVGEIGVVATALRTATVTARTAVEALHFPPHVVGRLAEELPAFRATLERAAAKRLTRDWHTE